MTEQELAELASLAKKATPDRIATLPCPTCGGSGSSEEPNPFFDPDDDYSEEDEFHQVACPDCHGEGSVSAQPCPHCDSVDLFVERDDLASAYVHCNDCSCRGPVGDQASDFEETPGGFNAVKGWNRRAALKSLSEKNDAAE